jgi:hypothetical protein
MKVSGQINKIVHLWFLAMVENQLEYHVVVGARII